MCHLQGSLCRNQVLMIQRATCAWVLWLEILRRLAVKLVAWLITSNTQSVTSVLHQSLHPQTSIRDSQVWPQSGFCKSSRHSPQARLFPQQRQIWQWKKKNRKTTETNKPKLEPKHVASQNLKLAGNPAELRNRGFRSSGWQERLRLSVLQRRSNNCERLSAALGRQQQRANPWANALTPQRFNRLPRWTLGRSWEGRLTGAAFRTSSTSGSHIYS